MPPPNDEKALISWARQISQKHSFWDFHAHPFCVFSDEISYRQRENSAGLFSTNESAYRPSTMDQWPQTAKKSIDLQSGALSERALLLSSRLIYTFSGPQVFSDLIEPIGISHVMLLPFVRAMDDASEVLDKMASMFSDDGRFRFGYPVLARIPPSKYEESIEQAIRKWQIQCIKLHPNLAGIDPLSTPGETSLYSILEIAGRKKLPVVIHGGRTPGIHPPENREFGTLARLSKIDWSKSSAPVIIAHAGCYGLETDELEAAIGCLKSMFERHPNLLADTSALSYPVLHRLMTELDRKRFIFGSDALYFSLWSGWVTLLRVLTSLSSGPEEDLIRIASINPQSCLGLHSPQKTD